MERFVDGLFEYCEKRGVKPEDYLANLAKSANPENRLAETNKAKPPKAGYGALGAELNYVRNYSIKSATADIERLQFNTAIAKAMELLNALQKYDTDVEDSGKDDELYISSTIDLLKLISPFAPHFAEEAWETLKLPYSIFNQEWPRHNEAALVRDIVEMAVQVNGTVRFKIEAPSDMDSGAIEALVRNDGRLEQYTSGGTIEKVIVIRGRLVNIVLK